MATSESLYLRRRLANGLAMALAVAAAVFGLFWLVWILWTTISKGMGAMNLRSRPRAEEGQAELA